MGIKKQEARTSRPGKGRYAEAVHGLQAELKQKAPFTSREQEAYLALLRTADALQSRTELKMKEFGLTGTQYNALRILRGAGPEGLPCSEIGERMITRDPDITRLLNRLEQRGLVERTRDQHDRRVIYGKISAAGKKLLEEMDGPVEKHGREMLRHINQADLRRLIDLLAEVRSGGDREHSHPERSRAVREAHRPAESKDPYP